MQTDNHEKRYTVTLTQSQLSELLSLVDLACKAGGLPVARQAVQLIDAIQSAPGEVSPGESPETETAE